MIRVYPKKMQKKRLSSSANRPLQHKEAVLIRQKIKLRISQKIKSANTLERVSSRWNSIGRHRSIIWDDLRWRSASTTERIARWSAEASPLTSSELTGESNLPERSFSKWPLFTSQMASRWRSPQRWPRDRFRLDARLVHIQPQKRLSITAGTIYRSTMTRDSNKWNRFALKCWPLVYSWVTP